MKGVMRKGKITLLKMVLMGGLTTISIWNGYADENKNLLRNADFEKIDSLTGLPSEWTFIQRGSPGKHCEVVTGNAYSGEKAVRISNNDPELKKAVFALTQFGIGNSIHQFQESDALELSIMAKAENKPAAIILFLDAKGQKTKYKKFTVQPGNWQKFSFSFGIEGRKYGTAYVGIRLMDIGSILIDNPTLTKSNANLNNLIENSSFEMLDPNGNPTGWIILNKNKNGTISVDKTMAADGKFSMCLSSSTPKEGGMFLGTKIPRDVVNKLKPGMPMKLSIKANTNSDPGVKFIYYMERKNRGKWLKGAKSPIETSYVGWSEKSFIFDYPDDGPVSDARIWVTLMTPGTLNVDSFELSPATKADIEAQNKIKVLESAYMRAVGFPVRHTYTLPETPTKFSVEYKLPTEEAKIELSSLDNGQVIKTWTVKNHKIGELCRDSIELPKLNEGAYKLSYFWKDGKDQDFFRIRRDQTQGVTFNSEKIMLLNGKPFFPIGMMPAVETIDMFNIYAKSAINTVVIHGVPMEAAARNYAKSFKHLNMAWIFETTFCIHEKNVEEAARKETEALLKAAKILPNVIGVVADELCTPEHLEKCRPYYATFFKTAPDFVAWQNHAPRLTGTIPKFSFSGVRRFTRLSDITGLDIYPVPEGHGHNNLPDKSLACVGKYTDLVNQTGFGEIPVWMVLQAFSWDEYNDRKSTTQPIPTYHQLRFMVWNAITHGARGIFYYQPPRLAKVWYEQFGKDISNINNELANAAKIIVNGKPLNLSDAPDHVRFAAFATDKERLFIAVNESNKLSVKCSMPLDGSFFKSPNGEAFIKKEFILEPYGVLILSTNPISVRPSEGFKYQGLSPEALTINGCWTAHPKHTRTEQMRVYFKQDFILDSISSKMVLRYCSDDSAEFFINGIKVKGGKGGFTILTEVDVTKSLKQGKNTLTGSLYNVGGLCGLLYELRSDKTLMCSGEKTLFSENGKDTWVKAYIFGKPPIKPWRLPYKIETRN